MTSPPPNSQTKEIWDLGDLQHCRRIASRFHHDVVCRPQRRREGGEVIPRHPDTPKPPVFAFFQRHRLGEDAMDIKPNDPHSSLLYDQSGSRRARGIYRSVLSAHPGKPQGRPHKGTGSRPTSIARSARTHVLPVPRTPDHRTIAPTPRDRQRTEAPTPSMPDKGKIERPYRYIRQDFFLARTFVRHWSRTHGTNGSPSTT